MQDTRKCPICGSAAEYIGKKKGRYVRRSFDIFRCVCCYCFFVGNPLRESGHLYDMKYYCGEGADPSVDYLSELTNPENTIRQYEWQGIIELLKDIGALARETRWLDYGCGNGGLVRYARQQGFRGACGFDEGSIVVLK